MSAGDIKAGQAFVRLYTKDEMSKGLRGAMGHLNAMAGAMGAVVRVATAAGVGMTAMGVAAAMAIAPTVEAASDLGETVSKVTQIFGSDAAAKIQSFGEKADKAIGQSKRQAMDGAATFATFGKAAGLTGDELVDFSTGLTTLASDLASFGNTSPEDAIVALGAALRGESEPIRNYGVLLDDATLRQEALALGIVKTTKESLTPQQKVLAAHAAILKQTADAQGDFARTSEGLANGQRILTAEFENQKAELGSILVEGFKLDEMLQGLTEEAGNFGQAMDEAAPQLTESLQELNEEIGRIGSTLAGQTESITAYRMAFDLLNATLISVNKQIAALGDLVSLQDNITRTGGAITEAAMNIMFGGWTQGAETEAFDNLRRQLGDIWNDEPRQNPQAISESMKANRESPVKAPMLPDEPVVREQPQDWDAVRRNRTAPVKAPNLDLTDAEKNRLAPVLAPDPDFVREMTAEMKRNRAAPVLAPILPGDDEEAIDTTEFGRQEKKLPRGVGYIGTFSAAAAAMGALGGSPMLQELKTGNKTQKQILAKLDSIEKRGGLKFA